MCTRAGVDLNKHFSTRILPVSTYGVGKGTVTKHLSNQTTIYMMETETKEDYHALRPQVRATTSDQGTERACNDQPLTTGTVTASLPACGSRGISTYCSTPSRR